MLFLYLAKKDDIDLKTKKKNYILRTFVIVKSQFNRKIFLNYT